MTILQADRRRDPYPYTWEIPIGLLTCWLLLAGIGIHVGRAIANLTVGAGWTWPAGRALFASLPDVLAGDPRAGLNLATAAAAASPPALYGWIISVQLLLLAGLTVGAIRVLRRWGPSRMKGMASPAEAEAILGLTRLRNVSRIIRPDLYQPTTATTGGHDGYHPESCKE